MLSGHRQRVNSVAFSADGQILASGSADETIMLWNWRLGTRLQTLRAPDPYAGMMIANASGLTDAQREALLKLGAAEHRPTP